MGHVVVISYMPVVGHQISVGILMQWLAGICSSGSGPLEAGILETICVAVGVRTSLYHHGHCRGFQEELSDGGVLGCDNHPN